MRALYDGGNFGLRHRFRPRQFCSIMAGMSNTAIAEPILVRLKQELVTLYGPRLKQVLLYGSRARGDFREDSDYDVLVVLEGPFHWWSEVKRLGDISWQITSDTGAVPSLKPVTPSELERHTGFMHNVRQEARAL